MKIVTTLTTFAVVLTMVGCAGVMPEAEDGVLDLQKLAQSFWTIDNQGAEKRQTPRFAVVEFTVEYVGDVVAGSDDQGALGFGTSMKIELPGVLYRSFTEKMTEMKRFPIVLEEVTASVPYAALEGTTLDEAAFSITSPGDGPVVVRYPVDGLKTLDDGQENLDAALLDVATAVATDATLQVRLRVGVHEGKAALLKGSVLRVVAPEGTATFVSKLTLVAPATVVAPTASEGTKAINTGKFVRSIKRLFGPYIAFAIIATEDSD